SSHILRHVLPLAFLLLAISLSLLLLLTLVASPQGVQGVHHGQQGAHAPGRAAVRPVRGHGGRGRSKTVRSHFHHLCRSLSLSLALSSPLCLLSLALSYLDLAS